MFEFLNTVKGGWFAASDCGLVRPNNEDSHLEMPERGVFCVADGMGGGECGELASEWVCEHLKQELELPPMPDESMNMLMEAVERAITAANDRIRSYAHVEGYEQMGSTVAILVRDPENAKRAAICNVGDSRIYRLRSGKLEQLTVDHTVGAALGKLNGKTAERKDPMSHVLTRAIGPVIRVMTEWRRIDVMTGDRYLICSDGVHDMLDDTEIAAHMKRGNAELIVRGITEAVMKAGAKDNHTEVAIVIGKEK